MAFKPANAGKTGGNGGGFTEFVNVEPKAGNRPAVVDLVVDLGIQEREDFKDEKTGEVKPQKPCHQVAVSLALVNDIVDYGGEIGKQPYRLFLNSVFMGEFKGINFTATPPKDANGKIIQGKEWGLHPASPITKLAKAAGREDIVTSMDLEQLLNLKVTANVEVKKTPAKGDKKDKDGNPIIYTNVNYKGATPVATMPVIGADGEPELDDEGNPKERQVPYKALPYTAKCITFDNATKEDIKSLRKGLIQKIKLAQNYAGSQMQKAIEEYEAEHGEVEAAKPASDKPAQASAPSRPKAPVAPEDQDDSDCPF